MTVVPITSADLDAVEVSWFSALCSDDYAYLGVPDGALRSSWEHCSDIARTAERLGFRNILCPSSYQVGQDTLSFVAGCAPLTTHINFLAAIRCGEMQPIMLARTVATLDHMLKGRLTLNVISSDFPGEVADSAFRYRRSHEVVEILRQAWTRETIDFAGEVYNFKGVSTEPARPYQQNGGPLLYFGGYSPDALELCGAQCDVYLMWPETRDDIAERMRAVGGIPDARPTTVANTTTIGDFGGDEIDTKAAVEAIVAMTRRTVDTIRRVHDPIDAEDPSTADLLHAVTLDLEKQAWLIGSENRAPRRR